jgi:hypothetical protein
MSRFGISSVLFSAGGAGGGGGGGGGGLNLYFFSAGVNSNLKSGFLGISYRFFTGIIVTFGSGCSTTFGAGG